MRHHFEATFTVGVAVETEDLKEAQSFAEVWAQRIIEVGTFEDANEDGTCTPKTFVTYVQEHQVDHISTEEEE